MNAILSFFEQAYSGHARYWWNRAYAYSTDPADLAPSLMAQQILRYATSRPPGRAIDLGAGEGADAIRLARLGWKVEAVEPTRAGAAKIAEFSSELGVSLDVHCADLRDFEPDGLFDLVVCNGVLHYLEDKPGVCRRMQDMTTSGGANAISLWSDFTPIPDCHTVVPTFPDQERGAVVTAYAHWKTDLLYFERDRADKGHPDMPDHAHSFIKLIARKP